MNTKEFIKDKGFKQFTEIISSDPVPSVGLAADLFAKVETQSANVTELAVSQNTYAYLTSNWVLSELNNVIVKYNEDGSGSLILTKNKLGDKYPEGVLWGAPIKVYENFPDTTMIAIPNSDWEKSSSFSASVLIWDSAA